MKKTFFILAIIVFNTQLFAEPTNSQTMSYDFLTRVGFGLSTFRYENSKDGFGGLVNFAYACNFNKSFAILVEAELVFINSSTKLKDLVYTYMIHVPAYAPFGDDRFDYTVRIEGFYEKQSARYVYVPLRMRYKYTFSWRHSFFMLTGLKFGIPVGGSYSGRIEKFTTLGYSYLTNQLHADEPENGFSTYTKRGFNGDLKLKFNVALSMEMGYDFVVAGNKRLYFGMALDYGLVDISSRANSHAITYNPDDSVNPKLGSIATASQITTFSTNLILRLGLNFEKSRRGNVQEEEVD